MKLEEWMKKSDYDVCAINETGLNENECVEVGDEYKWIGTNSIFFYEKQGIKNYNKEKHIYIYI